MTFASFLLLLACGQSAAPPPATPPAPPPAPVEKAPAPVAETVHVMDARARAMPPGSPNSAIFMTLHNGGDSATALVGAESSAAATVELHTHVAVTEGPEAGTMQMRRVPQIDLAAQGQVVLEPGGLHLMLIGLTRDLVVGQQLDLALVYADGSRASLSVPIQEILPEAAGKVPAAADPHAGHGG